MDTLISFAASDLRLHCLCTIVFTVFENEIHVRKKKYRTALVVLVGFEPTKIQVTVGVSNHKNEVTTLLSQYRLHNVDIYLYMD